jgi:hypothetical protein
LYVDSIAVEICPYLTYWVSICKKISESQVLEA